MRRQFRQFRYGRSSVVACLFSTFVLCCVAGGCAVNFADHVVSTAHQPGMVEPDEQVSFTERQAGNDVRPEHCMQGAFEQTGYSLDVAIEGEGFFQLQQPNGELRYTRWGSFCRDGRTGRIVNADGYLLLPQIIIPQGFDIRKITIGMNGSVEALPIGSDDAPVKLGQFQLAAFINPDGLSNEDGGCCFAATTASGDAVTGSPGVGGIGSLSQGYVNGDPTGTMVHELRIKSALNNLANIDTTGFRRGRVDVADLVYNTTCRPETAVSGTQIGNGVRSVGTTRNIMQGWDFTLCAFEQTQNPLDVAIEGDGFFQVDLPNGESRYTRAGAFKVDADGQLVNADGYILTPAITIPQGTDISKIIIGTDGTVCAIWSGTDEAPQNLGQIPLARFIHRAGLLSEDGVLFAATAASGHAVIGNAGDAGFGIIRNGFLEGSNVESATELISLISAQRAYDVNSRAIRASDEMLSTATDIVR